MASHQQKSWRSPNKKSSKAKPEEVNGKTIVGWGEGTHRGYVTKATFDQYSLIQGAKVVFLNAAVETADGEVF